jgi:hypothetical protein
MIKNFRRLVILHLVLGLVSIFAYFMRPGSVSPHGHLAGRMIALTVIIKVLVAWIPYFISGYYSTDVLPQRDPRATLAFMAIAVTITVIAACLTLNLFGTRMTSAPPLVFAGATVLLVASARLCAAIWRDEESEWDSRP